ncbi:MAG TPA: Fic family protein [Rhizomicrobium sp.]|jgi:Fic family protein|nr:Fic family protein [Rhizomicrobium sp.]
MKIPTRPPDDLAHLNAILPRLLKEPQIAPLVSIVDGKGRYLHWDQLRFKKVPDGVSHEEWWTLTKTARGAASQRISLADKSGAKFGFCDPPPLKAVLRSLDMSTGGSLASDATALSTGEGRLHLARSLAEEPFASSLIEGAATTRQIAKKLIFEGRAPRTKDERMVLNNYEAMQFVKLHKDEPLTLAKLLELHRIVTVDTLDDPADAGRVRTTDDVRVVDETNNEVLHQPPPAAELPARLENLIKFANRKPDTKNWVHPLVKAFILHFMLSYEHPFVDGNGRVARALFYWLALQEGYWLIEYVSISSVIAGSRIAYGKAFLYTETDGADLTYFLIYHAGVLDGAVKQLTAFVDRKRREVAALERRVGDRNRPDAFNHRQSWLLNEFARGRLQRVTVGEHERRNAVSYLTARKDLEALVKVGCLRKRKVGKTSIYSPVSNLMEVLSEGKGKE